MLKSDQNSYRGSGAPKLVSILCFSGYTRRQVHGDDCKNFVMIGFNLVIPVPEA